MMEFYNSKKAGVQFMQFVVILVMMEFYNSRRKEEL